MQKESGYFNWLKYDEIDEEVLSEMESNHMPLKIELILETKNTNYVREFTGID